MSEYANRRYMIIDLSEIGSVDFNQIIQKNIDYLRVSLDGLLTVVKWDGETPSSVSSLSTKQGPYTHDQIITIMGSSDWTNNRIQLK
jgi:hypothetical protein